MVNRRMFAPPPSRSENVAKNKQAFIQASVARGRLAKAGMTAAKIISSPQAQQIIKSNPKLDPIVELFNPETGLYHRVSGGATLISNMIPPIKKVGEQIMKWGEPAFKGIKLPAGSETENMNPLYGLSKAPNPKPVYLNTGIAPTCYANDFMTPVQNECSPMHTSAMILGLPTATINPLGDYLIKTIAFDIQTRAQANVNFSLDLVSAFSSTQIISAMNDVIRALQVYYYYASLLSHESDTRNKNSGMINLRNRMTAQQISDLTNLGRRLEDTPCPPRIVQWVRYMSMTYLSGNSQGAPIIKMVPSYDFETTTTLITTSLTAISTVANNNTFVLMRRAVPQWRIGTLYDVPSIPVYDPSFCTIFANFQSAVINTGNSVIVSPTVNNGQAAIMYNSFNNRLDGAAYAMCSASQSGVGDVPGLCIQSNIATVDSRKSFYDISGTLGWYRSPLYQFTSVSRPETYKLVNPADAVPIKFHLPGAEMCKGVTTDSLVQAAKNFVDFLFDINKISSVGKLSSFNKRGNGKI